jgi:hypothetical protein
MLILRNAFCLSDSRKLHVPPPELERRNGSCGAQLAVSDPTLTRVQNNTNTLEYFRIRRGVLPR